MSHRLRVAIDAATSQSKIIWDILENLNPSKSNAQTKMLDYFLSSSDEMSKQVFENSHIPRLNLPTGCTWIDDKGNSVRCGTMEDAKIFERFGDVELGSFLLSFYITQYPLDKPLLGVISLHRPIEFIQYDLSYRHICRGVVSEFAKKLNSSMAIFFYDAGDIDGVFLNHFRVFEYGEKETRPIQEFLDEIQKIAPPLDWDTDYSEMEQEFSHKAYFVDYYI